jgi:uncharacterized protein (DUF4415 family)
MSEKRTGIVTMELDLNNLPPLTEDEKAQLEHLRNMKDEDIDFSDIPRMAPGTKWSRPGRATATRGADVVAIDADLVEHFGTDGRADAAKVNAALREYVAAHAKAS